MKLYRGARQLQALVRLRTTSHSSGPSSPGAQGALTDNQLRTGAVMPNGPMLGADQTNRAPHASGTFILDSALESNRTTPTDAGPYEDLTTWVFTQELAFGRDAQPNEMRLSCGAS